MFDHWDNNCWLKDYILTIYPFLEAENFQSNLNKTEQKKDIQIFPDFLKVKGKNETKQSHKFKASSFDQTLCTKHQLREKYPYLEFFWSLFSGIWTE